VIGGGKVEVSEEEWGIKKGMEENAQGEENCHMYKKGEGNEKTIHQRRKVRSDEKGLFEPSCESRERRVIPSQANRKTQTVD